MIWPKRPGRCEYSRTGPSSELKSSRDIVIDAVVCYVELLTKIGLLLGWAILASEAS